MSFLFRRLVLSVLALAAILTPALAAAQSTPSDYTTGHRFDEMGREIGRISPDPDGSGPLHYAAVRNTYDARGNLIKVETGELSTWKAQSDDPRTAWGTDFKVLSAVETTYDARGRKLSERIEGSDGASALITVSLTQFSYDSLGRLLCTAVRMNPAHFASPPADACSLDPQPGSYGPDRITHNVYDAASQLLKEQQAWGTGLQRDYKIYTYSANGNVVSMTDASGYRAEMTYDGFDRQQRWIFPSKTTTGQANQADYEEYGYDADGNRVSLRKRDGTDIAYAYDNLGRVLVKDVDPNNERTDLSATDRRDVCYSYDLTGVQTSARFGSTTGVGIVNDLDGFGRIQSATDTLLTGNPAVGYQYDKNGNVTEITYPDLEQFDFAYDGLDRLKTIKKGSTVLVAPGYTARGAVGAIDRSGSALDQSFGYDNFGRLSSLDIGAGQTNSAKVGWDFIRNPASQIITDTRDNNAYAWLGRVDTDTDYAANGLNQYTAVGSATFCYDANGNLTDDGNYVYRYDTENRLVEMRARNISGCPSYTSGYTGALYAVLHYDPLGRLYEALKYEAGTLAKTTQFLYDGDALVLEYDGAGTTLSRYVHGSSASADDPLIWYPGASTADSNARNLYADPRGSVVLVMGSDGVADKINTFDEWGANDPTNLSRFQYTGQMWLDELGMYYYKARIYSARLGRFMQTDPVGYEDQVNLYVYVGNDPVNGVDFTGMYECDGGKPQCGAVAASYKRSVDALKNNHLTRNQRAKLTRALKALGAPGQKNGVTIKFASEASISAKEGGRAALGYTEKESDGTIQVTLRNDFGTLYDGMPKSAAGRDYSKLSAQDERAAILSHESDHVRQFKNGMTMKQYAENQKAYEDDAYRTGKLINEAYGSTSVYDSPNE